LFELLVKKKKVKKEMVKWPVLEWNCVDGVCTLQSQGLQLVQETSESEE
jgi:hypothetical protein